MFYELRGRQRLSPHPWPGEHGGRTDPVAVLPDSVSRCCRQVSVSGLLRLHTKQCSGQLQSSTGKYQRWVICTCPRLCLGVRDRGSRLLSAVCIKWKVKVRDFRPWTFFFFSQRGVVSTVIPLTRSLALHLSFPPFPLFLSLSSECTRFQDWVR